MRPREGAAVTMVLRVPVDRRRQERRGERRLRWHRNRRSDWWRERQRRKRFGRSHGERREWLGRCDRKRREWLRWCGRQGGDRFGRRGRQRRRGLRRNGWKRWPRWLGWGGRLRRARRLRRNSGRRRRRLHRDGRSCQLQPVSDKRQSLQDPPVRRLDYLRRERRRQCRVPRSAVCVGRGGGAEDHLHRIALEWTEHRFRPDLSQEQRRPQRLGHLGGHSLQRRQCGNRDGDPQPRSQQRQRWRTEHHSSAHRHQRLGQLHRHADDERPFRTPRQDHRQRTQCFVGGRPDHPAGYGTNDVIKAYNQALPGLVQQRAAAGKHVALVDMYTGFNTSTMLGSDSIHPNSTGYKFMADHWYAAIGSLLPK